MAPGSSAGERRLRRRASCGPPRWPAIQGNDSPNGPAPAIQREADRGGRPFAPCELRQAPVRGDVRRPKGRAVSHHPVAHDLSGLVEHRRQRPPCHDPGPPRVVDGQKQPDRRGHPVRGLRDDSLGYTLGIEAGVDCPDDLGKDVSACKLAPERRLQRPNPVGEIGTTRRQALPARWATGARLPTSPRQSALRPIWNGESF